MLHPDDIQVKTGCCTWMLYPTDVWGLRPADTWVLHQMLSDACARLKYPKRPLVSGRRTSCGNGLNDIAIPMVQAATPRQSFEYLPVRTDETAGLCRSSVPVVSWCLALTAQDAVPS